MAKVYYNQIINGNITLADVPAPWREQVREMLEEDHDDTD